MCNGLIPLAIFTAILSQLIFTLYMFPGVVRMGEMDRDITHYLGPHAQAAKDMTSQCKTYLDNDALYPKNESDTVRTRKRAEFARTYDKSLRVWNETLETLSEMIYFYGDKVPIAYRGKAFGGVKTWGEDIPTTVAESNVESTISSKLKTTLDTFFKGETVTRIEENDRFLFTVTLHGQQTYGKLKVKPSFVSDIEIEFTKSTQSNKTIRWSEFKSTHMPAFKKELCGMFETLATFNADATQGAMTRVSSYVSLFFLQWLIGLALLLLYAVPVLYRPLAARKTMWAILRLALSSTGFLMSFCIYNLFSNASTQKVETTSRHVEVVSPSEVFDSEAPFYLLLAWLGLTLTYVVGIRAHPREFFVRTVANTPATADNIAAKAKSSSVVENV